MSCNPCKCRDRLHSTVDPLRPSYTYQAKEKVVLKGVEYLLWTLARRQQSLGEGYAEMAPPLHTGLLTVMGSDSKRGLWDKCFTISTRT
jgi:hypothetical protein